MKLDQLVTLVMNNQASVYVNQTFLEVNATNAKTVIMIIQRAHVSFLNFIYNRFS